MSAIKSKAPLKLTMYMVASEVFMSRTKQPDLGASASVILAHQLADFKDKRDRDEAAVKLAALCIRVIEEVG